MHLRKIAAFLEPILLLCHDCTTSTALESLNEALKGLNEALRKIRVRLQNLIIMKVHAYKCLGRSLPLLQTRKHWLLCNRRLWILRRSFVICGKAALQMHLQKPM